MLAHKLRGGYKAQPFSIKTHREAAHLLSQASLGPTWAEIVDATAIGDRRSWVASQLEKPLPRRFIDRIVRDTPMGLDYVLGNTVDAYKAFYTGFVQAPALRGKCIKTLMRIFVMSERAGGPALGYTHACANWLDRLDANVFGNYVDLLESITYSPQMSMMLSHYANSKAVGESQPDENYAREIMQLFTIGLWELNLDGTQKLLNGKPIPTYTNVDIQEMAKVFTGLTRGDRPETEYASTSTSLNATFRSEWPRADEVLLSVSNPLYRLKHFAGFYDTSSKVALNGLINIPANTPGPQCLRMAHQSLVNHPNTAPFVCSRLIQGLVTSTPSPGYVERVASKFRNNGNGVVGDMKAVWTAILVDEEAYKVGSKFLTKGRAKDGLELAIQQLRSLNRIRTDGWNWFGSALDSSYGTDLFREPSIFGNFDLTSPTPEMLAWTTPITVAAINQTYNYVVNGEPRDPGITFPASTYANLPAITSAPEEITERLNLLFCGGQMSDALRADIISVMYSINATTDTLRLDRIWCALNLVCISVEHRTQL